MAGQVTGRDAVLSALQNGQELDMVLVDREKDTTLIRQLCEERGILLQEGSANDLWRMSHDGSQDALALTGRNTEGTLDEIMQRGGTIWFFDGVEYSTNLGFTIRTAEVSGADAVVLNVAKTHEERRTIRRASMRADRFLPVVYSTSEEILAAAKSNQDKVIIKDDDDGEKKKTTAPIIPKYIKTSMSSISTLKSFNLIPPVIILKLISDKLFQVVLKRPFLVEDNAVKNPSVSIISLNVF